MHLNKQIICSIVLSACLVLGGAGSSKAFKGMGGSGPAAGQVSSEEGEKMLMQHQGERSAPVATVNGVPVTMGALMDSIMEVITVKYGSTEVTETVAKQIRKEALEKLVLEELACQRAAALGITVEPAFIEGKIEAL